MDRRQDALAAASRAVLAVLVHELRVQELGHEVVRRVVGTPVDVLPEQVRLLVGGTTLDGTLTLVRGQALRRSVDMPPSRLRRPDDQPFGDDVAAADDEAGRARVVAQRATVRVAAATACVIQAATRSIVRRSDSVATITALASGLVSRLGAARNRISSSSS